MTITRRAVLSYLPAMYAATARPAGAQAISRAVAEGVRIQQHFEWGKIDDYRPMLLGNGDIGGLFDPFGGTHYDELRYGTGKQRDIRTLYLTQLAVPDYWVLEDQSKHYLDPRYYRPTVLRQYLTYGAPFSFHLRPGDENFPEQVAEHAQTLDVATGVLTTRYRVGGSWYEIETIVLHDDSVLCYKIKAGGAMRFEISPVASPAVAPAGNPKIANRRFEETKNGYHVYENEPDLIVLKNVSNTFCPACVAVSAPSGERNDNAYTLPAGEHAVFVAVGHQSLGHPREQAVKAARRAAAAGFERLREGHQQWWRAFWDRSYVSLPDKRIEQMWYRSVYYLTCCMPRRVRSFSPEGAYGIFPGLAGYHPQDSCYHLFAALSSNHPELCTAQIDYLLETLPIAQAVARNVYYLEGARYPWHSTPGLLPYLPGHTNEAYYLHEHHVNGWLAEFVRRYLEARGWERSLVARYYPVLREMARFFSAMLEPRGDQLEINYVPSAGQEESGWDPNRKNIFDLVVTAKWTLMVAADAAGRVGADSDEASRWQDEAQRLKLEYCLREDGTFGSYENDEGHEQKVPSQLIAVVMTSLFEARTAEFNKTFDWVRKTMPIETCSWAPGYYAIAAARLNRPDEALRALQDAFQFSRAPWLLFIENTFQVPGRMPYYLAGHALFVQAVNELLLQDWSGEVKLFPACPFPQAAFKLRAQNRVIEARLDHGKVQVLSDTVEPL